MAMKKYVGILLCLLLLGVAFKGIGSHENLSQDIDNKQDLNITELAVAISCGNHYGCGTILDSQKDKLIVVTAMHVIEDHVFDASNNIIVSFFDGNEYPASVAKTDATQDLAFLTLDMSVLKGGYSLIPGSANSSVLPSTKIFFVDANTSDVYSGTIASPSVFSEDLGLDVIYCYCQVTPGMSGTGMFDENGNYLGILLGGSNDAEAVCLPSAQVFAAYLLQK